MIDYINTILIVILIILLIIAIVYLKKKNDGDVYNKSEHEKLNDDLVDKLKKETEAIETDLKNLQTSFANSLSDVSKNVGENKGIIESKSTENLVLYQLQIAFLSLGIPLDTEYLCTSSRSATSTNFSTICLGGG